MQNRYEKLAADLRQTAQIALTVDLVEDGGTCNFDSLELSLPRWPAAKVKEAVNAAGLSCFKTHVFGAPVYVIGVPVPRQGNAQTRQAERMAQIMHMQGYQASVWYQMD